MNNRWGIVALIVAGLYWLQAVLVPLALAVLLTFMLSPVVSALQRWGLGRVPAVLATALLGLSILGGIGWTVTRQLVTLADELPGYSQNIHRRIADLRGAGKGGSVEKVQKAVADVVGEIQKTDTSSATRPKPVAVFLEPPSILVHLPNFLHALAGAGVVTVLVIFMLLERLELRDRVILLIGYRRMTATTRALDEAGERITRYLLMQSIVNGSFGVAVGLGLFLIGVPYAVIWGALAAALRFIPYVGAFVSALLPLAVSLAVFPGWLQPVLVVGLFVVLELVTGMVMEPWLYGQSAGVSQVPLLIAVILRLRSQCPDLKIVVGRWGLHDERDADRQHLLAAGADCVATTVLETQRALIEVGLAPGRPASESPPTPAPQGVPWTAPTTATALR
jgi:predicted PurR-regulated permease PerM